jgi:glycosyltransferase involved in cell wall biosynthesis
VLLVTAGVEPGPPPPPAVTVERLPGSGAPVSTAARLAAEPGRQAWLTNRFRQFGADAVYEFLALHSSAGAVAAHRLGIPHLVDVSAPLVDVANASRRLYHASDAIRMEEEVLTGAAAVLVTTTTLAPYAAERGARRVDVVPNAADPRRPPTRARDTGTPLVAAFVASMGIWHGTDTIVEAWPRLGPAAPRLLAIGDGPGRAELEAAGFDVRRPVAHGELPALLASADIGLAPYRWDAARFLSPMKVFEYLAAGLAVAAADLPGVTDHFRDDAVVLFPPGSAVGLANAVALLAGDDTLRARLQARGPELVASGHTWAHRAERVLQVLHDLAVASPVGR